jgi:uncharacterized protein
MDYKFHSRFGQIPIFAMIHLAGEDPVKRALEEIDLLKEEGVNGVIVENYHGSAGDVVRALESIHSRDPSIAVGVNILPNEFDRSLPLAEQYDLDFVQLDHVAGWYRQIGELDSSAYSSVRGECPGPLVLGGVWPKYYFPIEGSSLEDALEKGMQRADAIVVTGKGTGVETPLDKIKKFRQIMGDFPLIVGAGLNPQNGYEQLCIADGGIVGSCLKPDNDTSKLIDRHRVRDFMAAVYQAREDR